MGCTWRFELPRCAATDGLLPAGPFSCTHMQAHRAVQLPQAAPRSLAARCAARDRACRCGASNVDSPGSMPALIARNMVAAACACLHVCDSLQTLLDHYLIAVERLDPGTGLVKWRLEYRHMASPAGAGVGWQGSGGRCLLRSPLLRAELATAVLAAACAIAIWPQLGVRLLCLLQHGCRLACSSAQHACAQSQRGAPAPYLPLCALLHCCSPAAGPRRGAAGGPGRLCSVWQDGPLAARLLLHRQGCSAQGPPGAICAFCSQAGLRCQSGVVRLLCSHCALHVHCPGTAGDPAVLLDHASLPGSASLSCPLASPSALPAGRRPSQARHHAGGRLKRRAGRRAAAGGGCGSGAGAGSHRGGRAAGRVGGAESARPGCRWG